MVAALALAAPAAATNPQNAGLQVALRAQGLYDARIDAIVGPKTRAAVRAFQRQQGIRVTGFADARTRAALGPFGRPLFGTRTLRRGMFGWDVAVLQFLLSRHGAASPLNGYFDAPTGRAVRAYQRKLHLRVDGVVGPSTLAALGLQTRVPVPAQQERVSATIATGAVYVVRAGDTLTSIAAKHRTTVAALAKLNGIDPAHTLLIGKRLRLPAARKPAATPRTAADAFAVRASIDHWAAYYGVDAHLARALAWMESGYRQDVRSAAGAEGVMQLLAVTWNYVETVLLGKRVPHTADGNVRVGLAYFDHLLKDFNGNERLALAAWYEGEAAVRKNGVYPETTQFVNNVLALRMRM